MGHRELDTIDQLSIHGHSLITSCIHFPLCYGEYHKLNSVQFSHSFVSNSFSRTLSSSSTSEMVASASSRPVSGGWAHIAALLSVLPSLKPHAGLPGASFWGGTVARARGDGLDSTLKLSCLNRTPHSYICQGQRSETGLKSHLFPIF